MAEIKRREARLAEAERELQTLTIKQPADGDLRRLKASFRDRLARVRRAATVGDVPMARQALRKLVPGRIEFHLSRDGERGYDLRWSMVAKPLVAEGYIGVASPRGIQTPVTAVKGQ